MYEPGLLIDEKYFQMGVKQIKARMLPQLEVEIQQFDKKGEMHDEMEYYIVIYQLIAHFLAYLYLYGSFVSYIDFDLLVCCSIILSRKILARMWLYYTQFYPTLTTKVSELEKQERAAQPNQSEAIVNNISRVENDPGFKSLRHIETYKNEIQAKDLVLDIQKLLVYAFFLFCLVRLVFKHTLKKAIVLFYPILVQAIVFGNRSVVDFIYEQAVSEQPSFTRYKSAQNEVKYVVKSIVFNSLQAVYYIIWVPIHFSPSDGSVYIDYERYELMVWFYVLVNLLYYSAFYLEKRYFEMQFQAQVLGSWTRVYEDTQDVSSQKDKDFDLKVGKIMSQIESSLQKINQSLATRKQPQQPPDNEGATAARGAQATSESSDLFSPASIEQEKLERFKLDYPDLYAEQQRRKNMKLKDHIKQAEAEEQDNIRHGIFLSDNGQPFKEILTREQLIQFNHEIEEWRPNINYPYGQILRYNPGSRYSQPSHTDNTYYKRVLGYLNLSWMLGDRGYDPQFSYYQANGRLGNLSAPDDEWVSAVHYLFGQPSTILFTLQCACLFIMFLFTVYSVFEKRSLIFNLLHLCINMYIQHRWVFRYWQFTSTKQKQPPKP